VNGTTATLLAPQYDIPALLDFRPWSRRRVQSVWVGTADPEARYSSLFGDFNVRTCGRYGVSGVGHAQPALSGVGMGDADVIPAVAPSWVP
jgi:hypothetical protein